MAKIEPGINITDPTSFHGIRIYTSFANLEKKFGIQADYMNDEKVTYELGLYVNDIPVYIYDWKEMLCHYNTKLWLHLGTRTKTESRKVAEIFRDEYGFECR